MNTIRVQSFRHFIKLWLYSSIVTCLSSHEWTDKLRWKTSLTFMLSPGNSIEWVLFHA